MKCCLVLLSIALGYGVVTGIYKTERRFQAVGRGKSTGISQAASCEAFILPGSAQL